MIDTLLAVKKQMTSGYDIRGRRVGATVLEVRPNFITHIKNMDTKDGYTAIQLGTGTKKSVKKPQLGHIKKVGVSQKVRWLREVKVEATDDVQPGQEIKVNEIFVKGDLVKVTGTSKGRGFAGGVKKFGFKGGPKTHGQSDRERAPGSSGSGTTPGRVYKGKRRPGHMGVETVSYWNLEVLAVDKDNNLLTVKGGIPGFSGNLVRIQKQGHVKGHTPEPEISEESEKSEQSEQAVFQCKNHMMTAIDDGGYGLITFTPGAIADWSQGETIIKWDVSTLRTSMRDWWDVWVMPYDEHIMFPLERWLPDLVGESKRAIQIRTIDAAGDKTTFDARVIDNFDGNYIGQGMSGPYDDFLTPAADRRDTFELHISKNHIKFAIRKMVNSLGQVGCDDVGHCGGAKEDHWWVDNDVPSLSFNQAIVQFGHHSYNPDKSCPNEKATATCHANTWHWDNV